MELTLGLSLCGVGTSVSVNQPPTDIAWAGDHSVNEDAAFGTVIGGSLSATEPTGEAVTFSIPNASSPFAISGTNVILAGVLDFEAAASHDVTIRATDARGAFYEEVFTITVNDVGESDSDSDAPPGGEIIADGEFDIPPTVTITADGNIKIHGKKKSGAVGKIIYDLGQAVADRKYTMKYDPDFSLLSNQGKNAMVGFVFKDGNDFLLTGQRGDGSTGLDTLEVYGAGKWNAGTGFTENSAGDAVNGTQAGPNWQQMEMADDGSTYTLRSSGDDGDTFDDEFTDEAPEPFSAVDDPSQFGIGIMLAANDTGPFSVEVSVWLDEQAAVLWTPAQISTLLWFDASDAANLSLSGSAIDQWNDLSGNGNHVTQSTAGNKPTYNTTDKTIGGLGVVSYGTDDYLAKTGGLNGFVALNTTPDVTDHFTFVHVSRDSGGGAEWGPFDIGISANTNTCMNPYILSNSGGNGLHQLVVRAYGTGDESTSSVTENKTDPMIWSGVGGRKRRQGYINGTDFGANTADKGNTALVPANLRVGAFFNDVFFGPAETGELIIFYGQDTTNRQLCEGYLAWKWDGGSAGTLVAALDAGHPYKSAPPTL